MNLLSRLFTIIALALVFVWFATYQVNAQEVPSFGCAMRPGYRICSGGVCQQLSPICYPTNTETACPDQNGRCYAVENQQTCQAFTNNPTACASAGPFRCVEVPCDPDPAPTFNCAWLTVDGTRRCMADIEPGVCQGDEANDICYVNSHAQCSGLTEIQCLNAEVRECVRVACDPSTQPTITPTPGTGTPTPPTGTGTPSPPPQSTPPRSSSGSWPPQTNPPGYYAPDYPVDGSREHIFTPGERAVPEPAVGCSSTGSEEFHSLRPYQASPCYYALADIALMCANTLILEGDYQFSPSDCQCSCGGCTCSGSGQSSGCTCHCNCEKTFTLTTIVDVFDAELPIMGNTEDRVVNSQDQPNIEGIDHYAKVNEYVSWYLSGVNQRAEYGDPDAEYITNHDVISFSGPLNRLLPWDRAAGERNDQIERAGQSGDPTFDVGGRHNQIVACQSQQGVASACYTDGGQRIRVRNWNVDDVPIYSNYDNDEEYREAWREWKEDPENNLFDFIPMSSTEDRYGELQGVGNITVTGGNVSNASVFVDPAELFYPHMEEGRELTDLLQKTYLSKDFIEDDINGDGIPDINVTKTKHVNPANPPQCDLTRVRTNPGDTINPTELTVVATFTVQTSCEVPGNAQCDCDIDPDTGEEDCICTCTPGGAVCPGGTVTVTVDLTNNMPLAEENFIRTVASPYSPVQRIFPKIGSNMPIQGFYDMPGYSLVDFLAQGDLTLTDVQNPGGFPMPPKLFYPHIGSIHQYFLNCIQTALRPEGYGPYCDQGQLNDEDWVAENPPTYPIEPGDIVPPLPVPVPTDVQVVPFPTVPPVNVPESCQDICGFPIEDLATTVFAETSNGAQSAGTQETIANVMYNRACSSGAALPYTGANTILYQNMYSQSGGSYPPPTQNQIDNTHLALAQCLLNPTACPLQSTRFANTLSIMSQVCLNRQANQADPTNGSLFFSHQDDLIRAGISFNSCQELRDWLQSNMETYQQRHPDFGFYVGPPTPDQRWVPGSTTEVYQFGCYVLITGTNICAVDAGCR